MDSLLRDSDNITCINFNIYFCRSRHLVYFWPEPPARPSPVEKNDISLICRLSLFLPYQRYERDKREHHVDSYYPSSLSPRSHCVAWMASSLRIRYDPSIPCLLWYAHTYITNRLLHLTHPVNKNRPPTSIARGFSRLVTRVTNTNFNSLPT